MTVPPDDELREFWERLLMVLEDATSTAQFLTMRPSTARAAAAGPARRCRREGGGGFARGHVRAAGRHSGYQVAVITACSKLRPEPSWAMPFT